MLICRSSAKINLTLDLLELRPDGYHELQSVVHTVGLWDTLTYEFDTRGFDHEPGSNPILSLRCNQPLLENDDNLCLKAARAWLASTHEQGLPPGFSDLRITLDKVIPSGAGLGGGSGNAAATLLALNRHFNHALDDVTLHGVAARLGADVPFFLRGGCALMEGIGERLTPLPSLQGWLVIIKPPLNLSTPQVYAKWDELEQTSPQSTAAMRTVILNGDISSETRLTQMATALHNDLSVAAGALGLDVALLVEALLENGALGTAMTGSGSAVFGIFAGAEAAQWAASQIRERLSQQGISHSGTEPRHEVFTAPFSSSAIDFLSSACTAES